VVAVKTGKGFRDTLQSNPQSIGVAIHMLGASGISSRTKKLYANNGNHSIRLRRRVVRTCIMSAPGDAQSEDDVVVHKSKVKSTILEASDIS
jgi:hypothetical protein